MNLSYTAKLKLYKTILISIIVVIVACFLITPLAYLKLKSNGYDFAISMLNSFLINDMEPPVFSGTIKNGGSYYLSAKKVTKNFLDLNNKEKNIIQVTQPKLVYNTNNKGLTFSLSSNTATIDINKQVVNLPNIVTIISNQSYQATLHAVLINFKQNILQSNKKLTIFFDKQKLTANGIKINQTDNIITLKGPVEIIPN